jgi:hypothetical protein
VPVGSGKGKGPRSENMDEMVIEKRDSSNQKNAKNAQKMYMKKYKEAESLLKLIENKLKNHKKKFMNDDQLNWGYIGDLEHWVELMNDIRGSY